MEKPASCQLNDMHNLMDRNHGITLVHVPALYSSYKSSNHLHQYFSEIIAGISIIAKSFRSWHLYLQFLAHSMVHKCLQMEKWVLAYGHVSIVFLEMPFPSLHLLKNPFAVYLMLIVNAFSMVCQVQLHEGLVIEYSPCLPLYW